MYRCNSGCWTCRVRRKKCDEGKPSCVACTSRNIRCHGYGSKPDWMDGGPQEKLEAARLKRDIRENLKKRRTETSLSTTSVSRRAVEITGDESFNLHHTNLNTPSDDCEREVQVDISPCVLDELEPSNQSISQKDDRPVGGENSSPSVSTCESLEGNISTTNASSGDSSLLMIRSYREAELLMHYLDYVVPLQFRFYDFSSHAGGRGWLLWLLFNTRPLLHATLSLSALHQYTLSHQHSDGRVQELVTYHANALRDLQVFLENSRVDNATDGDIREVAVLACGVSLISFEGGIFNWQLHLNALLCIVDRCELCDFVSRRVIDNGQEEPSGWQSTALSFFLTVLLWFDLLSCVTTETTPRLPYRKLLGDGIVKMESVMGCTNRVMCAIGDLANLYSWKCRANELGILNKRELLLRSLEIEKQLEDGLIDLEKTAEQPCTEPGKDSGQYSKTVQQATRVFATGALVQLYTMSSDSYPDIFQPRGVVARNITALKDIEDPQTVRGLVWPLCVSGSMAEPLQQPIYRNIVRRALNSSREFGNLGALLLIMEKCWDMKRLEPELHVYWKTAMNELNTSLLLV